MQAPGQALVLAQVAELALLRAPCARSPCSFDTAVEEAQRALLAAKVEASSAYRGIGLVKLMGRQSGFIAMQASMASGVVDIVSCWLHTAGRCASHGVLVRQGGVWRPAGLHIAKVRPEP